MRVPAGAGLRERRDETLHTMESTVYGSPINPQTGSSLPPVLKRVKSMNFGVTFEHKGLRARVEIEKRSR